VVRGKCVRDKVFLEKDQTSGARREGVTGRKRELLGKKGCRNKNLPGKTDPSAKGESRSSLNKSMR